MIRPLQDRVLVKRVEAEEMTASGIIIPDTAKEKPQEGEVVAVGQGMYSAQAVIIPPVVSEGDTILYSKHAQTFEYGDYIIMSVNEVLSIVEGG